MRINPVNNNQASFNGIKLELSKISPAMRNHMLDSLETPTQRQYAQSWCSEVLSKLNKFTNERLIEEVVRKKSRQLGISLKADQVWPKETKASIFAVHRDRNHKDSLFGVRYENIDTKSNSYLNTDFYAEGASGRHFIGTEKDILRLVCSCNGKKLGGMMSFVSQVAAFAGYIISGYGLDEAINVRHNFDKFIEAELENQAEYQMLVCEKK